MYKVEATVRHDCWAIAELRVAGCVVVVLLDDGGECLGLPCVGDVLLGGELPSVTGLEPGLGTGILFS